MQDSSFLVSSLGVQATETSYDLTESPHTSDHFSRSLHDLGDPMAPTKVSELGLESGHYGEEFMNMTIGRSEAILGIVLTMVAFVSGTVGSILVIGAVMTTRKLRTPANALLVSLTIPDGLCVLIMTVILLDTLINRNWTFGWEMCLVSTTVPAVLFSSSIVHQMFLALQRYVLIVHNRKTLLQPRAIGISICASWLVPFLTMLQIGVREVVFHKQWLIAHNGIHCAFYHASPLHHERTILRSVITVMPVAIIVFCYVSIYRHHSCTVKTARHKRGQHKPATNGKMELKQSSPLIGQDSPEIGTAGGTLTRNLTDASDMSVMEDNWVSTSNQQSDESAENTSVGTHDQKKSFRHSSQRRRELLIVRTLVVLSIVNTSGYLPYCLLRNVDTTGHQAMIAYILTGQFFILALSSNAIVYGVLHREFR